MGDDMLSDFNSAISAAASVINGAASVLGSTFDINDTKELHEWSHEKSQEWMREDPAISLQGLKNAGLSPVSATGNYFTAGASGSGGYPHAPVADKAQRTANFNEAVMFADQLKTNRVQRDLLNAQVNKETAEASLINSQARGQDLQNLDYDNVMKNFGGFLNSQAYNNFIHAEITSDSRFVNQLRNRLDSAIIQGQFGDPDVLSAFVRLPLNQQKLVISEISKNFQDALLSMAKQKTEGTVQSLNRALKDKTEMENIRYRVRQIILNSFKPICKL